MSNPITFRRYAAFGCFVAAVNAYTVFHPKCSRPEAAYNFVANSDSRGTLEILWSSLVTILACTWTIQHPNVPEQRDGRHPGWIGDIRWGLKRFRRSIKLAVITLLAPEMIVAAATNQLLVAQHACRAIKSEFSDDNVPWSLTHSYFANMGGFVIRVTRSHGTPDESYHLVAGDLITLRRHGHVTLLPDLTEEQIHDCSKADPVLKALAVTQIIWSIAQVITRATRQLAISLLELSVVAFAICGVIIYGLYWKKPKFVQTAVAILKYEDEIPPAVLALLRKTQRKMRFRSHSLVGEWLLPEKYLETYETWDGGPVNNVGSLMLVAGSPDRMLLLCMKIGFGTAAVFGGVHLAGFSFAFPTPAEKIAWLVASLYTTFVFLFMVLIRLVGSWGKFPIGWFYCLARLFILVEIFRTLFFLPPDAYVSTWTSNIPHFA